MKNILKIIAGLALCAVSAFAQSDPTPRMTWRPLINGFNVAIPTNQGNIGLLSTNIEYTRVDGKVVFSYSVTGVTNGTADAFQPAIIQNDNNGDAVANATLVLVYGNTNFIPITNTSGFVTNWVLSNPTLGSQVVGSANVYPINNANSTNFVTINLYRSFWDNPLGDNVTYPSQRSFEPASTFTVTFSQAAAGGMLVTNIPAIFMQGARNVTATIQATNAAGNGSATLINFMGISQPQQ